MTNQFDISGADGALAVNVSAQDGVLPVVPHINVGVTVALSGRDSYVHIQGDGYPSIEVNQFKSDGTVKVLARSPHAPGGPQLNLMPGYAPRDQTFINGYSPELDPHTALDHLSQTWCSLIPADSPC